MRAAGWLLCALLAAASVQTKNSRPVLSFENPAEARNIKATGARVERVAHHATEGRYALQVQFEAGDLARVEIPVSAGHWRGGGSLELDATNTSADPLMFSVEVQDQAGAKTAGRTWWQLMPSEKAGFALPLNTPPPVDMGVRGEPPIPGFRILLADHKPVDLARIASVAIAITKPAKPGTIVFDNVRLGPPVSYDKIADKFGQFTREEWPGKLKSEADLKARLADEQAELKARPQLAERDEYGGWAAGPKLEATGYFRTVKRDGKWWLVTPSGHLFFSLGLNSVNTTEGGTVVEGREQMFEWLPAEGDPLASHYQAPRGRAPLGLKIKLFSGRGYSFLTANLERKYSKDWYRQWQEITLARLPAWGFNTIANWSDQRLGDAKKVPYTATLAIRGEAAQLSSGSDYWGRMHDAFDPRFAAVVEQSIRARAEQKRDDPRCLGYFVDNELAWGGMREDRTRYGLGLGALSLGGDSPGKRALVEQLKARYGEIDKLNAAWNTKLASWEDLLGKPYKPEGDFTPVMREDLGAFVKELARRYFRTIRETLRKYDPNHLYLGTRFSGYTMEEVEACAEFCDVMSFNIYRARLDAQWDFLKRIDRPVIIGEFHMGATDRGMFHTGLVASRDQADRARMYQEYVRSVADHPAFVGCHYFKYTDEPLTGRPGDGENYNIGFTAITDSVYPEMVAAAKAVHAEVYRRRASGN